MRKYELMVVMKKEFPHEDEKKRNEVIEQMLTGQKIEKLAVSDFGKKQLAYEIKKETEGCYILATFESEAVIISQVEAQVRLMDGVLRYLLTKLD